MTYCDGCGKDRRDVQSVGRDDNGDADAPDYCFLCRVEAQRGKHFDKQAQRYLYEACRDMGR